LKFLHESIIISNILKKKKNGSSVSEYRSS
jgi:hypothetical protein